MKYVLVVLLLIVHTADSSAQKKPVKPTSANKKTTNTKFVEIPAVDHHIYADAGLPYFSTLGLSVTYNYRLARHWSIGGGVQGYKSQPIYISPGKFIWCVYADFRLNIRPVKKNQFFLFMDLGIDLYKDVTHYERDSVKVYAMPYDNGFYTGLGFGYFRPMTTRGGGPYASFKMLLDWSTIYEYSLIAETQNEKVPIGEGGFIFSLGFKF